MKVYLVQHGEAKSEEEDPARPLTDMGREEVKRVADFLKRIGVKVSRIIHSGKLRASQTASIIGEALDISEKLEQGDSLEPLADPGVWAERLGRLEEDVMLVGHLPHLSRLASLPLTESAEREPVRFRKAGVVCLERTEKGWSLLWAIRPELIG